MKEVTNKRARLDTRYLTLLGTVGFVFSFLLPGALMSLQRERIEHEITERRSKEHVDPAKKEN